MLQFYHESLRYLVSRPSRRKKGPEYKAKHGVAASSLGPLFYGEGLSTRYQVCMVWLARACSGYQALLHVWEGLGDEDTHTYTPTGRTTALQLDFCYVITSIIYWMSSWSWKVVVVSLVILYFHMNTPMQRYIVIVTFLSTLYQPLHPQVLAWTVDDFHKVLKITLFFWRFVYTYMKVSEKRQSWWCAGDQVTVSEARKNSSLCQCRYFQQEWRCFSCNWQTDQIHSQLITSLCIRFWQWHWFIIIW